MTKCEPTTCTTSEYTIRLNRDTIEFKNFTKLSGGTLKLRGEGEGDPAVTDITWFRNEMLLTREAGRVKIRTKVGSGDTQWSRVRIKPLETMDTGFYRCQATNGKQTVSAESMVKVRDAFPN